MRRTASLRLLAAGLLLWSFHGARAQLAPRETADEAYRLAVGLHNMPLFKEAAEKLKTFLTTHPQDARADNVLYRLGDCQVHLEQNTDALASFQAVVDRHPTSAVFAESLFRVGELNQLLEHEEQSAATYALFLQKFPNHALAETARTKERTVSLARLYRHVEDDPTKTLALSEELMARNDRVGEEALAVCGSLLFNAGRTAEAAKAYEALIARFPVSLHLEEAHLGAANAQLKLDDLDGALAHLAKVTKTQMDEVLYLRGTILGRQKAQDAAAQAYRDVVAQHRESRYRPYCLLELGAMGQRDAWQQLLREYPKGELADEARYRLAAELAGKGQGAEALPLLEAIGADSKRRADADILKAELRSDRDLAGALADLGALEKQSVEPTRLSRTRYAVALAALSQQKPTEALQQLALILKDPQSKDLHTDCLYRTGLAQEQLKQAAQAEAAYRKLVADDPKNALAPFALLRITALTMEANPDAALVDLKTLSTDYPQFEHAAQAQELLAEIQYHQAWDAYKKNDFPKAAATFALLKDHKTYGAESTYLAGVSFRNADRLPEAEELLAFLIKNHPDYEFAADARELLGDLLSGQKRWQDAARHYGTYVTTIADPAARAAIALKQGIALYQLNQPPQAQEALLYAVDHGEAAVKAKAMFFVGELLLQQNKQAEAKDYFLKVAVLYRNDDLTPAALLKAAKCLTSADEVEQRRTLLQRLTTEYPASPQAPEAGEILKTLK